jgi:hypothetical protein
MAYKVSSLLHAFLSERPRLLYEIKTREALDAWKSVVDEYTLNHTLPVRVKDRQLLVHADTPVLANELSLRERQLRNSLNRNLGAEVIQKIQFRSGRTAKPSADRKTAAPAGSLSVGQARVIEETVSSVSDPELREPLKRLFSVSALRNNELKHRG